MAIVRLATTEVQVDDNIYSFATPTAADAFEACVATVDIAHCERDHPPLSVKAVGQAGKILFTGEASPAEDGGVCFKALVDGNPVECEVSRDALVEHFGASDGERPVDAYEHGKEQIHEVAERMLRAGAQGRVLIRSNDVGDASSRASA